MTTVKIKVSGADAVRVERTGKLTTGMVGAVARFSFDSVWNGLTKVAVFHGSGVTKDALEWDGDCVRIPAEVLRKQGQLSVGVEGRNTDGSVVIPTVWVDCGMVVCGANTSGDVSTDPDLPVWAQIQSRIGPLEELQTKVKENIVGAINEVLRSGGGSVDEDAVERIVEAYLEEHPPEGGDVDPEDVGQIVEEYLREHPVETDKELLVEGAPADAYVTGQNIRNIGRTLKAVQKRAYAQGEFISIRDTVLDIVGDKITLNDGYIYTPEERITVPTTTVDRNTESSVCQLVYDREDKAVRCVSGWATLEDDQILVAVIAKLYPGSINANHIPGKWSVDGVLYPRPEAVFGLNWYALGDSITRGMYGHDGGAGVDTSNCWAALVARYNGWTLTNMGVSGSGYLAKGGTE
ncbi:MAG: hypothetical protein II290_05540, partial [Oscillospiraceae bacterium]|nr:hypothetical protein [Oscillospiraceae bacterium]